MTFAPPLTLLLDLDNTLLGNDMDTFVPAYLQALSRSMASHADPALLIDTLLAATRQMVSAASFDHTLSETFDAAFYPPLGMQRQQVQATIDRFYAEEFPRLRRLTRPRRAAVKLVETAFARGYRVGIATNPLFPRTAIEQRLEWAGLSPQRYPFALVPSYETFHFAKPHPAFYAEFLAQMGWPDGPAVMVGDDPVNDIAPARQLGLAAFWVDPHGEGPDCTACGSLADVLPWLETVSPATLQPAYDAPAALLAILRATPAALATLTKALTPQDWRRRPQPQEWAAVEILCHLRDVESEVNLPRLEAIIREDNPFIPGQETDPWAAARRYHEQDGPLALQRFGESRQGLLASLEALAPSDWERPARHAIFGPTSLREIVHIIVQHDQMHVRQLHATLFPATR